MPDSFVAGAQPNLPPAPIHFTGDPASDPYFDKGTVVFSNNNVTPGPECIYNPVPTQQ
jgi:hypothetical protein